MDFGSWLWALLNIGVGLFATIVSILYAHQGVAYIPTRWVFNALDVGGEWVIARDDHPISFWVVIVLMVIAGGSMICFGAFSVYELISAMPSVELDTLSK